MKASEKEPLVRSTSKNYKTYETSSRSTLSQLVAVLLLIGLPFNTGLMFTMPTLVIGALYKNTADDLIMNDEEASWFGSILYVSHPIGSLISGYLQERFGRKGTMLLINIPAFMAWSTLYLATSVYQLYFVSMTIGLCIGFCEAPIASYVGEISDPHFRGTMSTMVSTASSVGGLVIMLGYLVPWRVAILACSMVPIAVFIGMTQIPESPTWLIMNGRLAEAQKSLGWVRGWVKPEKVEEEFQDLLQHVQESTKSKRKTRVEPSRYESVSTSKQGTVQEQPEDENETGLRSLFRALTDKKLLIPLRMVFIVFIFSCAVQLIAMRPFMVTIYNEFGFTIKSELIVIVTRIFNVGGAMMNLVFLRMLGKRKLTLLCHGTATTSIILLGIYCSFFTKETRIMSLLWIPFILLISVHFCSGFGASVIPWQLATEVFPLNGRGAAQGISAAWCYLVRFVMSISYLYLERAVKLSGAFLFYGIISAFGFIYYWCYLPETEGKTLAQIESYFTDDYDKEEKFSKPRRRKESRAAP